MASGCSAGVREIFEVFMVGVDLDRDDNSLRVDAPLPEGLHRCKYIFVIDRVVELRGGKLAEVEASGMQVASSGGLRNDTTKGEV